MEKKYIFVPFQTLAVFVEAANEVAAARIKAVVFLVVAAAGVAIGWVWVAVLWV